MKLRFEAPDGKTVETALKRNRAYIAERMPSMIAAYRSEGMAHHEAEALALDWANCVVRGCLKSLSTQVAVVWS